MQKNLALYRGIQYHLTQILKWLSFFGHPVVEAMKGYANLLG